MVDLEGKIVLQRGRQHYSQQPTLMLTGTQYVCKEGIVWEIVIKAEDNTIRTFTVQNDVLDGKLSGKALDVLREAIERWQAHPEWTADTRRTKAGEFF
jgi:hypothetical protein